MTLIPPVHLRFAGIKATAAGQQKLYNYFENIDEFKRIVDEDDTPYLGQLPSAFHETGLPPQQVLQTLDGLTATLRDLHFPQWEGRRFKLGNSEVGITRITANSHEAEYEITVGDQPFQFWLYYENTPPAEKPNSMYTEWGTYNNMGWGLYLQQFKLKDIADFYCGNPVAGWEINQWIDKETAVQKKKSSRSLNSIIAPLGYSTHSFRPKGHGWWSKHTVSEDNFRHGILIDRGTITLGMNRLKWLGRHQQDTVANLLASLVSKLPSRLRFPAFKALIQGPTPVFIRKKLSYLFHSLPEEQRLEAYKLLVSQPHLHDPNEVMTDKFAVSRTLNEVPPEDFLKAFQAWLNQPGIAMGARAIFGVLPEEHTLHVTEEILARYDEPFLTSFMFKSIPEKLRPIAFRVLLTSPANRTDLGKYLRYLPESIRYREYKTLLSLPEEESQITAVRHLADLPKATRKQAFDDAMAIPACREEAVWQLQHLPTIKERIATLKEALQDPVLVSAAVEQLEHIQSGNKLLLSVIRHIIPLEGVQRLLKNRFGLSQKETQTLIDGLKEAWPYRIRQGEEGLLPKLLAVRCPQLQLSPTP